MIRARASRLRASALVASAAVAAALCAGCGAGLRAKARGQVAYRPSSDELAAEERMPSPPFALAVPEDAIVRIVGPTMTCTGTVFDDDLILTAHHCLVERGPKGEFTTRTVDPSLVKVELGGDYFAWGEVSVRHIVAPPCGEAGGAGDVAVLVLTRQVVGLSTLSSTNPIRPRLDGPPRVGEELQPVGFGRCALSADAIRRKDRAGGAVRALTSETIHMDASICPGDSGGPVFAKGTHQIVGVVSLSAMDHDEATRGPSVMARIDAYRTVFQHASLIAEGASPNELPPLECPSK